MHIHIDSLRCLSTLTRLQELELCFKYLSARQPAEAASYAPFCWVPHLRSLRLAYCAYTQPALPDLACISQLTKLNRLALPPAQTLPPNAALARLPKLMALHISQALRKLSMLVGLQQLKLETNCCFGLFPDSICLVQYDIIGGWQCAWYSTK